MFMYFTPTGKVVFGSECILEMRHFVARANVAEAYAIWDLRYQENKMYLCFLLYNMKNNTFFCGLSRKASNKFYL